MTWNVDVASSVASGLSVKSGGGRDGTFCEDFRESFGALPFSTFSVISPPRKSSDSVATILGVCVDGVAAPDRVVLEAREIFASVGVATS
jgi:hypothetical protein